MGPDARAKLKIAIKGARNPKDETNPSQPVMPSCVVGEVLEPDNYFALLNKYPKSTPVRRPSLAFPRPWVPLLQHSGLLASAH